MSNKYDQMGFVSLDEIQNVFTTKLTELEQKIFPTCPSVERRSDQAYVLTFFDSIRLELQKRARGNLKDYLERNPAVKAEERKVREEASADKSRMSYEDRVKLGRQNFARAYPTGS